MVVMWDIGNNHVSSLHVELEGDRGNHPLSALVEHKVEGGPCSLDTDVGTRHKITVV